MQPSPSSYKVLSNLDIHWMDNIHIGSNKAIVTEQFYNIPLQNFKGAEKTKIVILIYCNNKFLSDLCIKAGSENFPKN